MQTVITAQEARKITGGREPLLPVEFETACQALIACQTIDDAKYWNAKAEALAAWAKIYHSDRALREAKKLKLHAYRKMSELAAELAKKDPRPKSGPNAGLGSSKVLEAYGFTKSEALHIRAVGRAKQEDFDRAVNSSKPPAPSAFKVRSDSIGIETLNAMNTFRRFCSRVNAADIAQALPTEDRVQTKRAIVVITEWLDELSQRLGDGP